MNEPPEQQKIRIAGYMAAVARLLSGAAGTDEAFRNKVELIVGGSAANLPTLLHWAERTRRTGLPMLLFSPTEQQAVPQVTLVAHVDGQTHIVESCMLWMGARDDRARLVPDGFDLGSFTLDDDLGLRRSPKAPARNFDAAVPGMRRAYGRLIELEMEQRESQAEPHLPVLLQKVAA